MSKKGKERKPSLGMASKGRDKKKESRGRDTGKPYARTGGTGKLLARRKAEEEEKPPSGTAKSASGSPQPPSF